MSIEEHPRDEIATPPLPLANAGRRRLGKAGIGAAGVLLTLESRVALATNYRCVAPSAASLSHGGNSNYVEKGRCEGQPPSYWCEKSRRWPCSKEIQFGALFSCGMDAKYAKAKLIDILKGYDTLGNDYYKFVGGAVATTYFNILAGYVTVLDEKTLFKMWNTMQSGQAYSPARNVYWTPRQVRKYLENTYLA